MFRTLNFRADSGRVCGSGQILQGLAGGIALLEPFFEEYHTDDVRVGATPSIEHIDPICTWSLDLVPISSPFLPTTPSPLHAFHKSLGGISGSQPSIDP